MEKILAVVTREKEYAERFCAYINRKKNLVLTAVPFESYQMCKDFSKNHNVSLIVADGSMEEGKKYGNRMPLSGQNETRTVFLSENGSENTINKFQSAEEILRSIMHKCEDMELRKKTEKIGRTVKIIGIYTPVPGTEKTAFALTLSKMLTKSRKTLYMNFEEFSGLSKITGKEYRTSLSDAVYYMKQGKLNYQKLTEFVYEYSGIEHIPPIKNAQDLCAVTGEDYTELMTEIFKASEYELIVAEMNSFAESASDIMDECEMIFVPIKDDYLSKSKTEEFEELIISSGRKNLLEKLVKITLPLPSGQLNRETYIDTLLYGEMGDLVRDLEKMII